MSAVTTATQARATAKSRKPPAQMAGGQTKEKKRLKGRPRHPRP